MSYLSNNIPICMCGTVMRCEKNSVAFIEVNKCGDKKGEPASLWSADLFKCPNCSTQVLTGLAESPIISIWDTENDEEFGAEVNRHVQFKSQYIFKEKL